MKNYKNSGIKMYSVTPKNGHRFLNIAVQRELRTNNEIPFCSSFLL